MRRISLFLLLVPGLFALNNSVTIYEATGAAQPGRPISAARWFARGEILHFPAPYLLGGVAITPWQADVKTRWSDGSVQFAIVSFRWDLPPNGKVTAEFRDSTDSSSSPGNSGLSAAELLAFNGGHWGAKIETTANSVVEGADARSMLSALGAASDQVRCWLCGPVVTQMIVEDRTTARSFDWGYQGSPVTVHATPDYTSGTFTSNGHGFVNGNRVWFSVDTSAAWYTSPIPAGLTSGKVYYIVNATANTFQISTTQGGPPAAFTNNGTLPLFALQPYLDVPWRAADSTHQSLHPIFVITAYAGWPGVRTEYILENTWIDRVQDQWFSAVKLYSGSGNATVAADMEPFAFASRTRWRKICWDGTAPAGEPACGSATAVITPRPKGIEVDYNLPYMVYSGAMMPYDTTRQNVAFLVAGNYQYWLTAKGSDGRNDATLGDIAASPTPGTVSAVGVYPREQYQTGGGPQIGLIPSLQALHLYVMGDATQSITTRQQSAELAIDANYSQSYWSTHYREGDSTKKYLSVYEEPPQATGAFGRPVSVSARPTFTSTFGGSGTRPADAMTVVGPVREVISVGTGGDGYDAQATFLSPNNGEVQQFSSDKAHSFLPIWYSYLMLGDWYAMEETQYWGAWYATAADPDCNPGNRDEAGRHEAWAVGEMIGNARSLAWQMRGLGYSYAATPTEDPYYLPLRNYFLSKLRNSLYYLEGIMDVQDGLFAKNYPDYTAWDCSSWNNNTITLPGHLYDDPWNLWAWGRCNQGWGQSNPMHFPWAYFPSVDSSQGAGWIDNSKSGNIVATYMFMYQDHVIEYLSRLGIADAETFAQQDYRRLFIDSVKDYNFMMSAYKLPGVDQSGHVFPSWTATRAALTPPFQAMNEWCQGGSQDSIPPNCGDFPADMTHSYQHMYVAALVLTDGDTGWLGGTGSAAAVWAKANETYQENYGLAGYTSPNVDPRWGWISQFVRNVQVLPGRTQTLMKWSSFSTDPCKVGISAAGFASSDDTGDSSVTLDVKLGRFVAWGLVPGATYHYRITCGPSGGTVRAAGSFTTATTGRAFSAPLHLQAPASLNAASAIVDYGDTPDLGATTGPIACTGGCSVQIPATGGVALYYRVRYLNSSGQAIPAGSGVQVVVL
jgi:hypothetical protein